MSNKSDACDDKSNGRVLMMFESDNITGNVIWVIKQKSIRVLNFNNARSSFVSTGPNQRLRTWKAPEQN